MHLFSLILINKNDPNHLSLCLKSIEYLHYPSDCFEVIIVDDGSQPSLESQIELKPGWLIQHFPETEFSCRSRARNLGTSLAKYEILIFIDGDQAITPDLLLNYSRYLHENPSTKVVMGSRIELSPWQQERCKETLKNNSFDTSFLPILRTAKDARVLLLNYLKIPFGKLKDTWSLFLSCNFCIYKDAYMHIGGFDEDFKRWGFEDNEFAYRLSKNNINIDFIDNKVLNFPPSVLLTEEKYLSWVENFALFYGKHQDVKILMYFNFEEMLFSTLVKTPSQSWFEIYKKFYAKNRFIDSHEEP